MHRSCHSVTLQLLICTGLAQYVFGAPPVITVWSPNPHYVDAGSTWTDPGVDCQDPEEGYLDVIMTPAYLDASERGTFILTYTCIDNLEPRWTQGYQQMYPWNTVRANRTVYVRDPPEIKLSGAAVVAISSGAFGPIKKSYCRSAESGDQQIVGLGSLDTVDAIFSKERQAKCLSLCRNYQSANAHTGKGCELRVTGAESPGCYIHTEPISADGVEIANYYCWKAEFNDPGVCCVDQDDASLTVSQTSYPLTGSPGNFQTLYWCEDIYTGKQVSITRDLIVDQPPKMTLAGDQLTKVTRGGAYIDPGFFCHDAEDGPIIEVPLGGYSELRVASTTASGFNGSVNYFATLDNKVTDGAYTGSASGCKECHVTFEDAQNAHWVRFDLGHVRIVYRVRIHKTAGIWTIRVGTSEVSARNPICGKTPSGSAWQSTTCNTLLAGRFVHIENEDVMTICEVQFEGQAGPTPPSSFEVISGCTDLHGIYELSGEAEELPSWKNENDATLEYDITGFVFMKSGSEYARASEGAALPQAVWVGAAGKSGCIPKIQFTPTDGCTWLFGFSSEDDLYKCADGTEHEDIGDCADRGGLAQCPPNLPQACAVLESDPSSQHGCATDCSVAGGGSRACGTSSKTGMPKSIQFFTGSWEGKRNDVVGDYGFAFIPKTKIFITHLGRHEGYNSFEYTLDESQRVQLWSTLTQQVIAEQLVGPSSEREGNYRMEELTTPLMLQAGVEYRLSQQCTAGMKDRWNDAIEQPVNMFATSEWRHITFTRGVHYENDGEITARRRRNHGYPAHTDSALQRAGMVNFKFYTPAARIEQVGVANTKIGGHSNLVFMCTDTMGQRTSMVRSIEVGCEGPNPIGTFGGNKVNCEILLAAGAQANFFACAAMCLANADCEAAEYLTDTSICSEFKRCTGKYERDDNIFRQVGICKVVDNPPTVVLGPALESVNKGGTWTPGTVICKDNEDQVPPTSVQLDTLSTAVAGVFVINFGCTDTAGQTTIGNYTVTVKDDCTTAHFADPNMHPDGPCKEQGGEKTVYKHGETCNAQCGSGWVPVDEQLVCISKGRFDYESAFFKDYECGEMPCDAPPVAHVKNDEFGVPMSCKGGQRIINDGFCIPNCKDGYIPTVESLECDLGTFIPLTFLCKLPAEPPKLIGFGKPDVLDVAVFWEGGAANDCGFLHWRLESRQTIRGFEQELIWPGYDEWQPVPGCGNVNHTDRATLTCHAYYRIEGATYEWRIKEECTDPEMNSTWLVSEPVKMRIVIPPEVLFQIPSGDVTFDPVQLMIAYTVPITLTDHGRWGSPSDWVRVNITRIGTWCVDSTGGFGGLDLYSKYANQLIESGGVGEYVRLTGQRIAIIKPPDGWLQPGCDFNVTLELGLMQTVDVPSKPTPWTQFNFTHIDLAPEFKQFILGQKTTVTAAFQIHWNLITVCNCTLVPTDEDCPPNPEPTDLGCVKHELGFKEQIQDTGFVEYFVMGLYPGTEYRTDCDGWKFGKPWIPIEKIPEDRYDEVTFETLPDTDASVKYFYMNVTAVCDPVSNPDVGIHLQERYKEVMPPQFSLGYTVQILDWREACVGKRQMLHDEKARITVTATVQAVSIFAVVRWLAEPQADAVLQTLHHFDYTKDTSVNADPLIFTFRFDICPLAAILVPDGPVKCTKYHIKVQCVDISFGFDSFNLDPNIDGSDYYYRRLLKDMSTEEATTTTLATTTTTLAANSTTATTTTTMAASLLKSLFSIVDSAHQEVQSRNAESVGSALQDLLAHEQASPGRRLTETHFIVDVGTGALMQNSVDRESFDWRTTSIHLGPIFGVDGFRQNVLLSGETNKVEQMGLVLAGQGTRLPVCLQWEAVTFATTYSISFTSPNLTVPAFEAPLHVSSKLRISLGNVPNVVALINETDPKIHTSGDTTAGLGAPGTHIQIGVYKDGRDENLCGPLTWPDVDDWTNAECNLLPAALANITVVLLVKDYLDGEFHTVPATLVRGQVTYKLPTHTGLKDAGDWALNLDNTIDLAMVSARPVAEIYPQGDKLPSLAVVQLRGATLPGYEMRIQGDSEINMCQKITWMNASCLQCHLKKCINITGLHEMPSLRMYIGDLTTNSPVPGLLKVPRPIVDGFSPTVIDDVGRNRTIAMWGKHFGEISCKDMHMDATQFLAAPTGAHITIGEYEAPCRVVFQNNTYLECVVSTPISDPLEPTYVGIEHPPARRTALQTFTFRKGNYLNAKNMDQMMGRRGGRLLEEESEEGDETEDEWMQWQRTRQLQRRNSKYIKLELTVVLMECPAGYRRSRLDLDECEPCRPGRFSTITSEAWPLRCEVCPEGKYSDQEGSNNCKECPENTYAAQPASSIEACVCKPGFYSQHYNETRKRTEPGTPCLSCSSEMMTDEPLPRKETCGASLPTSNYCDVSAEPCCAPEKIGVMYYRVCKAYCPGGTHWPIPKWTFSELELRQVSGPGTEKPGANLEGPKLFEPQLARCDPPVACLNAGACHHRYTGYGCGQCVFGYYRDKYSKECVPCGDEQVVGMVIMSAVCVMMSVGGLFFASSFMRLRSDIVFEHEMKLAAKEFILEPLMKSKGFSAVCGVREKRITVILHKWDVGASFRYAKTGHLGMVFRVNVKGVIHVAGILPQSPVSDHVKQGWKLVSVNGVRPKAKSENEVHRFIKESKFPLRFVFRCPKVGTGTGTLDGLDNDRKMIVMLMGVMNAFNQISMFDFEWPPIFQYLAALAAQFSFSFNFFHPECSVPTPFNTKWMGFLAVPYVMMGPLVTSYLITRFTSTPGLKGTSLKARLWMLRNALARTMCMAIIALLPFHLEQLLVPFACVERAEGTYFVSATPDTICSFKDPRYGEMLFIASCGGGVMVGFYTLLLIMLYKSFNWQFGNKVREKIPFYCGMVDPSVFGQLGYVEETRWRVMSNVVCCNLFDPTLPKLHTKERLEFAAEYLYPRTRKGQRERIDKLFEAAGQKRNKKLDEVVQSEEEDKEAGIENEDTASGERSKLKKGVRRWRKSKFRSPPKKEGNVITFGWILIVNLFWRQLFSLITIKMSEGNLVVVGAAMQMLIFGGNVTMLIVFKPYKSVKVSKIESTMLAALFMVLWCAVIKDLLSNHVNAHLFQDTLEKVNNAIDVMAIVLMTLVVCMPSQAIHEMITKVLGSLQSRDSLLNEIYMVQTMRKERDSAEKRKVQLEEEADAMQLEGGLVVPPDVAKHYNAIRDAVARINESHVVITPEQRRRFVHFIQIVRALPDDEEPKSRFQHAIKGVLEENMAAHAFHDMVEHHKAPQKDLPKLQPGERELTEEEIAKALPCHEGHPLQAWPTTSDDWWCSECRATCLRGTWVHRCFKCNYHLCPKCVLNFKAGGKCNNGHIMVHKILLPWRPSNYICIECQEFKEGNRWTCDKCGGEDICFNCRPEFFREEDEGETKKKGIFRKMGVLFGGKNKSASAEPAAPPTRKTEKIDQDEDSEEKATDMGTTLSKGKKVGFIGGLLGKSPKRQAEQEKSEAASSPVPPMPPPSPPRMSKAAAGFWPARAHIDDEFEDEIEIREPLQMEQEKTESDDDLHF